METEKLTINKLAPYLPYGLQICYRVLDLENGNPNTDNPDDRFKDCIMVMNGARLDNCLLPITDRWYDKNLIFKPLLIPLSELTFEGINKELPKQHPVFIKSNRHAVLDFGYKTVNILLKHHFDVFNLIEKGLAINKTLSAC